MLQLQCQVDKFLQLSVKEIKCQRKRVFDDYDSLNTSNQFHSILVKTMKDLQGIREIYEDGIITIHKLINIEGNWKLGFGLEMIFKGLKKHAALQEHIFTQYQSLDVNNGPLIAPKKEVEEEEGDDPLDIKTDEVDFDDFYNFVGDDKTVEFKDSYLEVVCKEEKQDMEDQKIDEYTKLLSEADFKPDLENISDEEQSNKKDPDYKGGIKLERTIKTKKKQSKGTASKLKTKKEHLKGTASCRLCTPPISFPDNFARSEHIRAIHTIHIGSKFECNICKKIFTRSSALRKHHKRTKTVDGKGIVTCVVCNQSFCNNTTMKQHFITVHDGNRNIDRPFQCDECDKAFSKNATLVVHKRRHSGERPFKCDQCLSEFISPKGLSVHVRRVHLKEEQKTYTCKKCGRSFGTEYRLSYHIKKKHGDGIEKEKLKKYVCDQCGLKTDSNSYLKIHIRVTHKGERPFACDECDKTFTRNGTFQAHKLIHTGLKTFQCEVCDKSFALNKYLVNHIRTHTGEKPYKCPYCEKHFAQSSDRLKHQKTHKNVIVQPDKVLA